MHCLQRTSRATECIVYKELAGPLNALFTKSFQSGQVPQDFDTVPHRRLISKLTAHGITGKTNRWIEHWLTDRRQRVYISGAESDCQKVTSGVPDCTTGINTRPNVICYLYKRHLLNCSKLPGKVCWWHKNVETSSWSWICFHSPRRLPFYV